MKDKKWKILLFVLLVLLVFIVTGTRDYFKEKRQAAQFEIEEKSDKKEKVKNWNKQKLHNLKETAEDNRDLPKSDMDIVFVNFDNEAFSFMSIEEKEKFKEKLMGYLEKKELEVTTATLHPESVQDINEYEKYIWLDVDYPMEDKEELTIRAICDTYTDTMRFSFKVEYGD